MLARALGLSSVVVALSCVGGCGKSEGGEPIPRNRLASRIASLICESMASCCQGSGFAFDVAGCISKVRADYEEEISEELQGGRVVYDEQAAGECLEAVAPQVKCGEVEGDAAACERIFRGTVALGQACSSSRECAPINGRRASCSSEDGVSPEVCMEPSVSSARRGKAGEACSGTCSEGDSCSFVAVPAPGPGAPAPQMDPAMCYRDDGLYCSNTGCAPLLAVGEPCQDYDACDGQAFCDLAAGVCSAPRKNGAVCSGSNECQSGVCEYLGDLEPTGACVAQPSVTAEECAEDFSDEPPDSSSPSGDPPPSPGP